MAKMKKLSDEEVLKAGYRDDPYKGYNPSRINNITEHNLIGKKRKEIAEHNKRYEALSKPANDAKLNAEWFYRTNPDVDRMDDEGNVINKSDWKACSTNTRYGSFSHGSNNCGCNGGNC